MDMKPTDIPQQDQHQGSTQDQIKELILWANRLGLYDAADFVERTSDQIRLTLDDREYLRNYCQQIGIEPQYPPIRPTSLYAANCGPVVNADSLVLGLWYWDKETLERAISDRKANGEAFENEMAVQVPLDLYNRVMRTKGWPEVKPDPYARLRPEVRKC